MTDETVERATSILPNDVSESMRLDGIESKREQYERLAKLNRLDRNGEWMDRAQQNRNDAINTIHSVASTLELTDFQRERAEKFRSSIPADKRRSTTQPALALAVCGVSGALDGRDYSPELIHPNTTAVPDSHEFVRVATEIDAQYHEIKRIWELVERECL